MKVKSPLLFFVIGLFFNACQQHEGVVPAKGRITFSLSQKARTGGRIEAAAKPAFMLLSIEDANGKLILENKKLSMFSFGQGYVSETLELSIGDYKLTQFMVLDASEKIIYATPVEGSDLARYVSDPLPIEFAITKDDSTQVVPQVLDIIPADGPESFGYVSFGFDIISVKLKEIFYGDQNSEEKQKYVYSYQNEKLQKITLVAPDWESTEYLYEYDVSGLLIKKDRHWVDYHEVENFVYVNNKLTEVDVCYMNNGASPCFPSKYTYDKGQLQEIASFVSTGEMIERIVYYYNKAGDIMQAIDYSYESGKLYSTRTEEYFYDNMHVPSQQMPDQPYLYSLNGLKQTHNVIRAIHTFCYAKAGSSPTKTWDMTITYKYNEMSYPVMENVSDGKIETVRQFVYGN